VAAAKVGCAANKSEDCFGWPLWGLAFFLLRLLLWITGVTILLSLGRLVNNNDDGHNNNDADELELLMLLLLSSISDKKLCKDEEEGEPCIQLE
jgi:hypothetical protein